MISAFVGYKEFCRSRTLLSHRGRNTLPDLQNSSYPTQPHSLIAKKMKQLINNAPASRY